MEVVIFSVFSLHKLTSWGEKNKVWIFGKHLVFWTVCNKMNFCLRLSCFTLAHYCFSLCNHCFVMQPDRLASLWSQNLCLVSLVLFGPNVLLLLVIFFSLCLQWLCPWAVGPRPHAGWPHVRTVFTGEWESVEETCRILFPMLCFGNDWLIICCRTLAWHHLGLQTKILRNCPQ